MPSLVGAGIAGGVLILMLHRAYRRSSVPSGVEALVPVGVGARPDTGSADPPSADPPSVDPPTLIHVDRRAFLRSASLVAGGAVLAGAGADLVKRARGGALAESREAIDLPAAADPAGPLPTGIAPGFVTSNAGFYRVDTALTVPRIDVDSWSCASTACSTGPPSCPSPICSTGR